MTPSEWAKMYGVELAHTPEGLQQQVVELAERLEKAKDVYRELKPKAKREARLHNTLVEVYETLSRMRITTGSDVGELREQLEKAKKLIEHGLSEESPLG